METQLFLNVLFGIISFLGGWLMKMLMSQISELKNKQEKLMIKHIDDMEDVLEKHTNLALSMPEKYVSKDLLDKFQICTSIPGKVPLDPNKINILWQKNSWDQPNFQWFFRDKTKHNDYDWYVFNSHWNYEKFRYFFKYLKTNVLLLRMVLVIFLKEKYIKREIQ